MRQSWGIKQDVYLAEWRLVAIEDQIDFAQSVINEALDALHAAKLQAQYGQHDHLAAILDKAFADLEAHSSMSEIEDEIKEIRAEAQAS